jgi:hypothetical protein
VSALVVVALLVDALEVRKLEEEPNKVVMSAEIAESAFAIRLVSTFRLVIEEVAATNEFVFRLVVVAFDMLAFVADKFVIVAKSELNKFANKLVEVELLVTREVRVALPDKI